MLTCSIILLIRKQSASKFRLISGIDTRGSAAQCHLTATGALRQGAKNALFSQLFLCLSRACLGKMIVFI